jgi:tetratricopeptide (TPR) repeat protein
MGTRFPVLCLIAAAAFVILSAPGMTQVVDPPGPPGPPGPPTLEPIQPPKDLPRVQRGDRTRNLEFLFEALKVAPDDTSAKHIEERIWALWVVSNSDTTNLLMTRVKTAVEAQDLDLAIKLLDTVIELKPDYLEGWNRRATLYYMKKDFGRSLADIRQVLAREPRHFGALSGLGLILQEFGDDKRALDAFRKALEIHPRLQKIPDAVKALSDKLEGRDI